MTKPREVQAVRSGGRCAGAGAVLAAGLALALLVLAGRPAAADAGDGLRGGKFLLHPAVYLEYMYDTNLFRDSTQDVNTAQQKVSMLRLLPEVSLQTYGGAKASLRGNAQLDLRQYLSDQEAVARQSNFGAHLGLDGELGKGSAVGLVAREQFHYQPEAGTDQSYQAAVPTFDRFYNDTNVGAVIRPGGGALEFTPGYELMFERFPDFAEGDRTVHSAVLKGRWRFMPKTAVVLNSSYGWRSYSSAAIPDSNPLRVTAGLVGLITTRLAVVLEAGYGNSFAAKGESFQGPIGALGVTYKFTDRASFEIGYDRDYKDSPWSNYYDSHLFHAKWQQLVAGRWSIVAGASYELMLFSRLLTATKDVTVASDAASQRQDGVFRANAGLEWRPNDWLSASVGYRYEKRGTNASAKVIDATVATDQLVYASYDRHQLFSRFGFIY